VRVAFVIFGAVSLTAMAGCGSREAEFANREDLDQLVPEAQDHIRGVLDKHFGTPTEMVVWERLPIHFHGAYGTFAENEAASGTIAQLKVNLIEQNIPIKPAAEGETGPELLWVSGKYVGQDAPHVQAYDDEESTVAIDAALTEPPAAGDRFAIAPGAVLIHGRLLYAEHCQHCHGVSGDGNGPTAEYLNPRPRDYRLGKFKFTSTQSTARAQRDDLARIIENGIPGTYMPSFKLLEPDELKAVVEYVRWLAMRGEIEFKLVQILKNDYSQEAVESAISSARESDPNLSYNDARAEIVTEMQEYLAGDWQEEFNDDTKFLAEQWREAEASEAVILPQQARVPNTAESRARGRELYLGQRAKCATCHGDSGLGDGPQTVAVQKNPLTNEDYPVPGLFDEWGNPIEPRNLTRGIYRGGRRPVDLYRRIHAGIKGTPMPAFGTVLNDNEIWDIVNYVTYLPFEAQERRPGDGAGESRPAPPEVAATKARGELQIAN
jgi:mono/diheme cytochrome c family protein